MTKTILAIAAVGMLIYLPLFLYSQISIVLERINTFGYKLADHEKLIEGLPEFRLRIPFEMQIKNQFQIRPLSVIGVGAAIFAFLVYAYAGEYLTRRFKTRYDRKSFSHLLTKHQRKRGLCRIEYTATKRFNVYGGKGLITRHTIRCFLCFIFKPIYIIQNKIAEEYNWPRRRWWNLQKGRVIKD